MHLSRSTIFFGILLSILPFQFVVGKEHRGIAQAALSTPVTNRDWSKHPAIVVLPATDTLFALGDIHGDCDRMLAVLTVGKLIAGPTDKPDDVRWTGGTATLIITGDMIDKYDHAIHVIAFLRALEIQVEKAGGHLIACLGNHEAEFLADGGAGKKGEKFAAELTAAGLSPADVAAGKDGAGIGAWMRNLPAGAKAGEWFFCHAGNTQGKSVDQLETDLERDLCSQGFSTPLLIDPNSMLEARMHPRPWFEAGDPALHAAVPVNSKPPKKESRAGNDEPSQSAPAMLVDSIKALGAKHLVIGHQPGRIALADFTVRPAGQMFSHYGGLFFMIDTGMSRGANGNRGALLGISSNKGHTIATALYVDGVSTVLWKR